jgi:signal transduction histidine kinase
MLVDDPARIDPQNAETYRDAGARSILAAPMTLEGRTFGVLVAFSDRPSLFAGDDLQILLSFADATAAFIARSELVQQAIDVRAEADSLQLKEEFLSAAAHDLRSPLTVLLGQAQLMRRRMRPGEDRAADVDAVESMLQEARRMRRMTEDLLDAARPETGRFIGDRTPIDLAVLAAEVATATATSSERAVRVEASPAVAAVDGARIVQVIENLLNNAIKFSPDGSEILVRIAAEDARAHITVRDSGIGIPAAELEIIFERFRRGSEVASHGFSGSGVGLYLCKRIVEEHDGQIWAESKPGEFTELHVVLPLAEE